jgi:hypothetical protein
MSLVEETQTESFKPANIMKPAWINGNQLKICHKLLIACKCAHLTIKYSSLLEYYLMVNCLKKYVFIIPSLTSGVV